MNYYAVIDTNVVVSSMLKSSSLPGKVMDYVIDGTIIPFLNQEILNEYKEVLSRNEFGFEESDINELIQQLTDTGIMLDRTNTDFAFTGSDDAVFYEIVLTARQSNESYLVTGNIRHFPAEPFVVTPREMIEIIEAPIV